MRLRKFLADEMKTESTADSKKSAEESSSDAKKPPKTAADEGKGSGTRDAKDSAWVKETLDAHNKLRASHGAPPLQWSDECWASAKKAAEHCAAKQDLEHAHCAGPSGKHGQNGFEGSRPPYRPKRAIQAWYDEIKDYD